MEEKNQQDKFTIRFTIMAILLLIILCASIVPKTLQNDTYYTIKIGEYILENGITMQDPFSWHEGLKYTFPHWAYDVATYLIYNMAGFDGIYISTIVLCCTLGIITYLTNAKLTKNKIISFIITLITMIFLKGYIAARAQLVSFILFVLTIYFIESFLNTGKKRYAIGLIIIPILIANLHLAVFPFYFILYLPYIGEYIVEKILNSNTVYYKIKIKRLNKKLDKKPEQSAKIKAQLEKIEKEYQNLQKGKAERKPYKIIIKTSKYIVPLIIIMIICVFTGLLTPLKETPYTYLVNTMKGNTTQNISEHLPLRLIEHKQFLNLLLIYAILIAFTDTKIRLSDLFLIGGLTLLAFITRRQESMVMIIGSFVLTRITSDLINAHAKKSMEELKKLAVKPLGVIVIMTTVVCFSVILYKPKIDATYVSESSYPVQASEWILENLDINNIRIYNEYNYGSYLLFKGIPVFIDSRADLYTPEFNEGIDIFTDFINISALNYQNMQEKLDKYNFTHIMLKKDAKLNIYIKLKPEMYKEIYSDNYFIIYENTKVYEETK